MQQLIKSSAIISIGCDPEVMVFNTRVGHIVPVCGLLGGTKEKPIKVAFGAYQEDNVNAEFNTDPAYNALDFTKYVHNVLNSLDNLLPEGHHCVVKSSHNFTKDQLQLAGPNAMKFGCDPDFDAKDGAVNYAPSPYTVMRTCGGHVHIGWGQDVTDEYLQRDVVKMCDYLLGLWSVGKDKDTKRREMYGKAGCYRPKSYGVEYRTLSNFWIASSDDIQEVFKRAVQSTDVSKLSLFATVASYDEVREVINTSDKARASEILEEIDGLL